MTALWAGDGSQSACLPACMCANSAVKLLAIPLSKHQQLDVLTKSHIRLVLLLQAQLFASDQAGKAARTVLVSTSNAGGRQ